MYPQPKGVSIDFQNSAHHLRNSTICELPVRQLMESLSMEHMIVEASLQLPIIRDLKSSLEPDFVFVIGTRITW